MRVLIFGGRAFGTDCDEHSRGINFLEDLAETEWPKLEKDGYGNWLPDVEVVSGCARGADTLGEDRAIVNWCRLSRFPAEWDLYGKSAGYRRNKQMLDYLLEARDRCAVPFPGGKGTANMRSLLDDAGVKVYEYAKQSQATN